MTDVNWLQYLSSQRLSIATLVLVLQFSSAKSRKRHFLLLGFPNLSKTNMPSRPYGLTSCIKNQYVVPAANCSNRSSRRRPEKKIVSMDKNQHTNAPGMNTKEKKNLRFSLVRVLVVCPPFVCAFFFLFCVRSPQSTCPTHNTHVNFLVHVWLRNQMIPLRWHIISYAIIRFFFLVALPWMLLLLPLLPSSTSGFLLYRRKPHIVHWSTAFSFSTSLVCMHYVMDEQCNVFRDVCHWYAPFFSFAKSMIWHF